MSKGKSSVKLRRITHLKLLMPGLLVAILVLDGLLGYTMPDFSDGIDVASQKVYAAEAPELEELAQTAEKVEPKGPAGKLAKVDESGDYKDGEYIGSAKGFGGKITVKVTIKDGKITSIKVLSASGETKSYFTRAKAVIKAILKKQSTNVDAVSGATYSSNGIIKAVRNALVKAEKKKSGRKRKTVDKDENTEIRKPVKPEMISGGVWKDGTYVGEGEGFGGKLHVQVTIENGKITAIELLDSVDGKEYISKAKAGIFSSVMQKQGTDVDSVTGATFSSYGLIEAINDALKRASSDAGDDSGDDTGDAEGSGSDPGGGTTDKVYRDGIYTSTVACTRNGWFDYDIIITLTVKEGRIDTLSVYKGDDYTEDEYDREENDGYLDMAVNGFGSRKGMISRILETQSADVDTVTGATYSSSAIKSGVSGILSGIEVEKKTEEDKKEEVDAPVTPSEDTAAAAAPSETDIAADEAAVSEEDVAAEDEGTETEDQLQEVTEDEPTDSPSDNVEKNEDAESKDQKEEPSSPLEENALPTDTAETGEEEG